MSSWIQYLSPIQSAPQFRLWSGISLVSGALERRVWAQTDRYVTFPDLYIMLVARPGVGKFAIGYARQVLTGVLQPNSKHPAFHVASDSMSFASMTDELGDATQTYFINGIPHVYHSLYVAAEELSLLMPAYDPYIVSRWNTLFNSPDIHRETRRTGTVRRLEIKFPQLNLLMGAQPAYLNRAFPDDIWETGIGRRVIMVYADRAPRIDIFTGTASDGRVERAAISKQLAVLSQLQGRMSWTPTAFEMAANWHNSDGPPKPTHSKLEAYNSNRTMFMVKLSIVSAASRTGALVIDTQDVARAIGWLTDAEDKMPDVFRAMVGRSDKEVIEELHRFTTSEYVRKKRQPVSGKLLRVFLQQRIPSDRVDPMLEYCQRAGILACPIGGDFWTPQSWMGYGEE